MIETLRPGETGLAELERIYRTGAPARIHPDGRQAVMASAERLREGAGADRPLYGVNTDSASSPAFAFRRTGSRPCSATWSGRTASGWETASRTRTSG